MTFRLPFLGAEPQRASPGGPPVLTVVLICFLSSYATVMLMRGTHGIAALWITNAVMIAALLVRPSAFFHLFLGSAAGIAAANLLAGDDLATSLGLLAANSAEVLASFALLRRLGIDRFEFGSLPFLARFLPVCGLVGPAVSATLGAAVASPVFAIAYSSVWITWFSSCSLGMIIVAPLLIALWRPLPSAALPLIEHGRAVKIGAFVVICLVNIVVFSSSTMPVPLVPFAVVVLATVLFGQQMASIGIIITASAGLASLVTATGPLTKFASMDERVLMLQGFLAVLALTCLPIAAVLREQQVLSNRLALAEARHRMMSDGSGDAILHVDRDGTIVHASRAVTDLTGLTPEALVGHPGTDFMHTEDRAAVARTHRQVIETGGAATIRYRYTHQRDGDERWLEVRTRAIHTGSEVSGVISTVRDVTQLAAQERAMAQEASTDPLTGLANRRYFLAKLDAALTTQGQGSIAVAMLDIDHFKRFNDRYGHAAGDAVLCAVARAADAALRAGDLIARLGGEEFAILLPGADDNDASIIAERVRSAIAAQVVIFAGEALRVTVSIGVVVTGDGLADAATLLAAADARLYTAKNSGRNCVRLAA